MSTLSTTAAAGPNSGNGALGTVFRWLAAVLFIAVVVQVGLAGYGAFHAVHAATTDRSRRRRSRTPSIHTSRSATSSCS